LKRPVPLVLLGSALLIAAAIPSARGQGGPPDGILVPDTSVANPADAGKRAHTNHMIRLHPAGGLGPRGGMTPTQLRGFYGQSSTGGSSVIAIVDAYDYPTALSDFNTFSNQFGLPVETSTNPTASSNTVFQVVYASGSQPRANGGWAQEEALDIEWAHAMAPGAKIVLVEAASNSFANLFAAVDRASSLTGVKEVSMSWGSSEFSSEPGYDSHFPQNNGIVYFASSGDTGGVVNYPAASPNVVAAGGTHVNTDSAGNYTGETGWSGSGGGSSAYEPKPSYQTGVANTPASARGVPDLSSDADPNTGVCVYDSTRYQGLSGWLVFGGTSVSSPCLAGMVNLAGHSRASSGSELAAIYAARSTGFHDIVSGSAGSFRCQSDWDFVTGVGSPLDSSGL
jgi:kumamolisin